jgi:hypothetical protein
MYTYIYPISPQKTGETLAPPLPLLLISVDTRDLLRVDEALLTSFKETDMLRVIEGTMDVEEDDDVMGPVIIKVRRWMFMNICIYVYIYI